MRVIPKLDVTTANRVQTGAEKAEEGSGFEVLAEGMYPLRLRAVEVTTLANSREPKLVGCPMWKWEFEIPEGHEHAGRRFWTNRILPQDNGYAHADFMMSKFAQPFTALGGTIEDDTDDLIGKICKGYLIERVIESGAKAGEKANSLEELVPLGADEALPTGQSAQDDDYQF